MRLAIAKFLGSNDPLMAFPLLLVHCNIMVYAGTYWMQQTVLPYISESLGVDVVTFGTLKSVVNAMALIGGPIFGFISDSRGAKTGLIISMMGSVVMYGLLYTAHSIPLLFASRIPALVLHAMLCSQAAISKMTPTETRAKALGRLSLSYGIGMITGSSIGGSISKLYGYHFTALLACLLSLQIVILNYLYLPDLKITSSEDNESDDKMSGVENKLSLSKCLNLLAKPQVRDILVYSSIVGVGLSCYHSTFPILARDQFQLESDSLGMLMSFGALVGTASDMIVGVFVIYFGNYLSLMGSSAVLAITFFAIPFASTFTHLLILNIPTSISSRILYTVSGALMSTLVDPKDMGLALSMSHASRSVCGIIAPLLGGYFVQTLGNISLGFLSGVIILFGTLYLIIVGRHTLGVASSNTTSTANTGGAVVAASEEEKEHLVNNKKKRTPRNTPATAVSTRPKRSKKDL